MIKGFMSNHRNLKIRSIVTSLRQYGFVIEYKKAGWMIKGGELQLLVHEGKRAYHPLRRWLKQNFQINITEL